MENLLVSCLELEATTNAMVGRQGKIMTKIYQYLIHQGYWLMFRCDPKLGQTCPSHKHGCVYTCADGKTLHQFENGKLMVVRY